jgi:SAM-dependent methyltransferase
MAFAVDSEIFFDICGANYELRKKIDPYECQIIDMLKEASGDKSILDIGCGNGLFVKMLLAECPDISISVMDPSKYFLDQIQDPRIKKIHGKLPDQMGGLGKYDIICMRAVLHHLTSGTIGKSQELVEESLIAISKHLNPGGMVIVVDMFYDSYLYPAITRSVIFYLCKLQNKVGFQILSKEFLLGLEVCFLTKDELKSLYCLGPYHLRSFDERDHDMPNNVKKHLLFLREWGWGICMFGIDS